MQASDSVNNTVVLRTLGQEGGEGRKSAEVTRQPKQSSRQFEPQLILPIKAGGRVNRHYANLGLADCLFYCPPGSDVSLPFAFVGRIKRGSHGH